MPALTSAGDQLFGHLAKLLAPQAIPNASSLVILEPSGKDVSGMSAGTPEAMEALADLAGTIPAASATFLDRGGTYEDVWDFVLRSAAPTGPTNDPVRITIAALVSDNRAEFELMARARVGLFGDVYRPVLTDPPDWLAEGGWTSASFRIGGDHPDPLPDPSDAVVVPDELPDLQWRLIETGTELPQLWEDAGPTAAAATLPDELNDPSRAVDFTARVAPVTTATSGVELSFEYRVVGLKRPWLRSHLCELSGWTVPGLPVNGLSNGEPRDNPGMLPVITTRMLVVRRLVVKAHWSSTDRARAAGTRTLALGPFVLSGAEGFDGSELTRPAPQVVAWLAAIVPDCPKAGAPTASPGEFLGRGEVVSQTALNVRSRPSTQSALVGSLLPGQAVTIECKTKGQLVDGNRVWYRLAQEPRGWASARFIKNLTPIPPCSRQ
ncbi:SH3 domain-containing protein [Streptomyces sp. NPDC006314]|uniref:SH3 domain-containing protein n=1 Tax=Streptomyces sp. NPDC006314 TaxID=3154475 RepID=UPI00339F6F75